MNIDILSISSDGIDICQKSRRQCFLQKIKKIRIVISIPLDDINKISILLVDIDKISIPLDDIEILFLSFNRINLNEELHAKLPASHLSFEFSKQSHLSWLSLIEDQAFTLKIFKAFFVFPLIKVLGTVQTAIDGAKKFLNREQDRLDGRPLWMLGRRPKIWTAELAGQNKTDAEICDQTISTKKISLRSLGICT
ncbi:hypothetical protein BpHYR1_016235 [Brachionus plicatilis]|uniref:Uncharacterized protein n=1 Tax=Brachionus plicatilis TaxID=10195 RepID=A0A3M7RIK2_BRAPC|nr:hypothetical protein BpHYR1_016235 [Brachionus plicatilis]